MKQIFISGASMTYGVGGSSGGWADMLKRSVHKLQYGNSLDNKEKYEVYNFACPGFVVEQVAKTLPNDILPRTGEYNDRIIVFSVGMNNAKSEGSPDTYVTSIENYNTALSTLCDIAEEFTSDILFVGYTPVNEDIANTWLVPEGRKRTYFYNNRLAEFNYKCREVCKEKGVEHIDLFEKARSLDWKNYLSSDGLHVNNKGHQWIHDIVWPYLKQRL